MAATYTTLVGAPPSPLNVSAWKKWYRKLLNARIAYCKDYVRAITYYVSSSGGSDSNNGLSPQAPFQTLAKVQTVIDASSGNIAFLFKRDDEWNETAGIILNKDGVLLSYYSSFSDKLRFSFSWFMGDYSSKKPFFNRFTVKYNRSGWTNVTGDRWSRTDANDIAWVRDQSDRLGIVYTRVTTTTLVTNTPLSYFYDSGATTLHINSGVGVDPNTRNLEAVISNTHSGIDLVNDRTCAVGLRADGQGIQRTGFATQQYALRFSGVGTAAGLFYDCEGYYSDVHTVSQFSQGTGGFGTFVECKTGYARYTSAGDGQETLFNMYSDNGSHESIAHNCECTYGTLPHSDWVTATVIHKGHAGYGHTGTGNASLVIFYGMVTKATKWGAQSGVLAIANIPTASAITDVRCFIVNEVFEENDRTGQLTILAPTNMVQIGCKYYLRPNNAAIESIANSLANGWAINTTFQFDMANITIASYGVLNTSGNPTTPRIYNCHINYKNYSVTNGIAGMVYSVVFNGNVATGAELKNSIISASNFTNGATAYVAINNLAAQCTNNAYFGITQDNGNPRGYNLHANKVALSAFPPIGEPAFLNSQLYEAGTDLSITVDANDYPIEDASSIGPAGELPYHYGLNAQPNLSSADSELIVLSPAETIAPDGTRSAFTFIEIPDIIVVDDFKFLPPVSYNGLGNWTVSGLVVTLAVGPTSGIYGLKLRTKK